MAMGGALGTGWSPGYRVERLRDSLEPRLSVPDFVSIFLQSCETKSGTESLGLRLAKRLLCVPRCKQQTSSVLCCTGVCLSLYLCIKI